MQAPDQNSTQNSITSKRRIQRLASWTAVVLFATSSIRMSLVTTGVVDWWSAFLGNLLLACALGWFIRWKLTRNLARKPTGNTVSLFAVEFLTTDFLLIVVLVLMFLFLPAIAVIWWYLFDRP